MLRLLASMIFALLAAPAWAQEAAPSDAPHVIVVSVGGDAPEPLAREAREVVTAALERDGMRVMSEGDIALRVPPSRMRACDAIACAHALGVELGVATVAAVAVWMSGEAPGSVTVSLIVSETRAHTASEDVGEGGLAAAASAAVTGAQQARSRALLVEGSVDVETSVREAEQRATPPAPPPAERPVEQYVLPAIMGGVGLVLAAVSVYAYIGEQCFDRGPSGVCLRGDRPNIGLGAIMTTVGGLMIGGAIVWLVFGGEAQAGGPIDIVVGPEGGGLTWRGTF